MKLDLHIHSKYSFDSYLDPEKIIHVAKKKGLDGIAITDHNTIKGGLKALKYKSDGLTIIIGSEITTEKGDILGLFLNEEIKSNDFLEVVDKIKEQNGIAVLAHPYKHVNILDDNIISKVNALEGFNARVKSSNEKIKYLSLKHKFPVTAGSDAHFYFEIGRGVTMLNNINEFEDIKKAIINGNTKIYGETSPQYVSMGSKVIKLLKTRQLPKKIARFTKFF